MEDTSFLELLAYFIGLMLIVEGMMPFFFINHYRSLLTMILEREPRELQHYGGVVILIGCVILLLLSFF